MSVFNPAIFIGEAVPGSTAGAPLSADANGNLISGITNFIVTSTTPATTASSTDALLTGMSVTPPLAGTYLVLFSADVTSPTAGAAISFSIYVNAAQIGASLAKIIPFSGGTLTTGNARANVDCMSIQTITAGEVIEIEWSTSAGTMTCNNRRLIVVRLS